MHHPKFYNQVKHFRQFRLFGIDNNLRTELTFLKTELTFFINAHGCLKTSKNRWTEVTFTGQK